MPLKKDFIAFTKKEDIQKCKNPIAHFGKWKNDLIHGKMTPSPFILYDWLTKLCGIKMDESAQFINVAWGAIFSVSRKLIHQKPKEFYEYLYRYLNYNDNPEEGHFFERSWYTLFHNPVTPKKYIYVIPLNKSKISSKIENIISQIIKKNEHEHMIDQIHYWHPYQLQTIYHPEKLNHISSYKFIALQNIFSSLFHLELELKESFSIKINVNDDSHYEFIFDIQKGFTIFMNYSMIFQKQISNISEKNVKNIQFTIYNDTSKDKNVIIYLDNQEVYSFSNKNIHFNHVLIRSSTNHQVFQIRNNNDDKDNNKDNLKDNKDNIKDNLEDNKDNLKDKKEDVKLDKIYEKYFMYDTQKQEIDIYYKYNYLEHYVKNIEIQDYLEHFI